MLKLIKEYLTLQIALTKLQIDYYQWWHGIRTVHEIELNNRSFIHKVVATKILREEQEKVAAEEESQS